MPENRELFLISDLYKIKNPFSLFRQRAANFQISTICANALHWQIQKKICLSKKGITRQRNTFRFLSGKRLQNDEVAATLIPGRKADVENTTLWQSCDNVIRCRDNQNLTLLQRRVPAGYYERMLGVQTYS